MSTEQKYDLCLADPPWHFSDYSASAVGEIHERSRGANKHYPTMDIEAIKALTVGDIMQPDSILLLWVCNPLIPEGLEVMRAWGFEFKTVAFNWIKSNKSGTGFFFGMGYYTRANSELVLLGKRGKGLQRLDMGVGQLIYSPVRKHSKKPALQYEKIDRLFGNDINRIELFARRRVAGWTPVGNEIDGQDIRDALNNIKQKQEEHMSKDIEHVDPFDLLNVPDIHPLAQQALDAKWGGVTMTGKTLAWFIADAVLLSQRGVLFADHNVDPDELIEHINREKARANLQLNRDLPLWNPAHGE